MAESVCWWEREDGPAPGAFRAERFSPEPSVNLSNLKEPLRGQVWAAIKQHAPDLAEVLTELAPARKTFGGALIVARADLPKQVLDLVDEPTTTTRGNYGHRWYGRRAHRARDGSS